MQRYCIFGFTFTLKQLVTHEWLLKQGQGWDNLRLLREPREGEGSMLISPSRYIPGAHVNSY